MPFLALLGLWGVAELIALIAVVAKIGFFATLGLWNTEDRSAVLIYLNLAASQLYILADSGVLAVIPQNIWDDLAARTLRQFKAGGEVAALDSLIADSAALLRQHFGKPDDPHGNELPDNPVIIE